MCEEDSDCSPDDIVGPVSIELVRCVGKSRDIVIQLKVMFFLVDGMCECNECFMLHPDTQRCFMCEDYPYNLTTTSCGEDVRQDQRRAFFLSFFLSATGAANFYIKVYGLGMFVIL